MKNRVIIGFVLLLCVFIFSGCDNVTNETKVNTYYYEAHLITRAQYDSLMSSVSPGYNYTYNQILYFRSILRDFNGTFLESNSGVSESEWKTFSYKHGISPSEYTQAKNSLDTVGNLIYFFNTIDYNYIIWMYVEKE